ncbi:MAG TPA: hypothetical protein VG889_00560 [Rhizomicrobium sp.]|nr:hypothetical protein [Rhizomicrobium sp.]
MKTFVLLAFATFIASTAHAADKAQAVIAASRLAMGGAAWDKLTGSYEEGDHAGGKITYRTWLDFRRGSMRVESRSGGTTTVTGFDGRTAWRRGPDGAVRRVKDPAALKEAILTAYVSFNGYYFPERYPASFKYLRAEKSGSHAYDVVEVTPKANRAFELWFDQATHKISRLADVHAREPVIVDTEDYRTVDGIAVPFKFDIRNPKGVVLDRGNVHTVRFVDNDPKLFEPR